MSIILCTEVAFLVLNGKQNVRMELKNIPVELLMDEDFHSVLYITTSSTLEYKTKLDNKHVQGFIITSTRRQTNYHVALNCHRHLSFFVHEFSNSSVQFNLDVTKGQRQRTRAKRVRYNGVSLSGYFPYISLLLGPRISFVTPRTSSYRGSLYQGSTVTKIVKQINIYS